MTSFYFLLNQTYSSKCILIMNNNFLIIASFWIIGMPCSLEAQHKLIVYKSTLDYIQQKPMHFADGIAAEIKAIEEDYIHIKKFYSPLTNKQNRKLKLAWAIRYNGIDYFNLFFFSGTKGIFIPLARCDVRCAMTMSDRIFKRYGKRSISSNFVSTNIFKKPDNHTQRILISDPSELDYMDNAKAWPLTTKNFCALISGDRKDDEARQLFIESNQDEIIRMVTEVERSEER